MKTYSFAEVYVGLSESFQRTVTEKDMDLFGKLSGDFNPMHTDESFATKRGYSGRVVYGMLVSSFYSALVGMYLLGKNCLLNQYEIAYRHPVYIGDTLTISGKIIDKREGTKRCRITAEMRNQKGEVVNTAEIVVSFTNEK